MPAYRGVDKIDLMRSIAASVAWLKSQQLGPASSLMLGEFREYELLTALDKAQTDAEVAKAMQDSNVGRLLFRFHDVFAYETESYSRSGPMPEETKLFLNLRRWGAFSPGNQGPDLPELEEEIRQFRIRKALAHLSEAGMAPGSAQEERFGKIIAEVEEEDSKKADWLDSMVPILVLLQDVGDDAEIRRLITENVRDTDILLKAVHGTLDVRPPPGIATAGAPILPYNVPLDEDLNELMELPRDKLQARIAPLKQRVREALAPFYEIDEVEKLSSGLIGNITSYGVIFHATRRAAQAVADTLRDVRVFDMQGRRITPGGKPPAVVPGGFPPGPAP